MEKNTILKFIATTLTLGMSVLAWHSVDSAINVAGSSVWIVPLSCFSALFIFLALGSIIFKETGFFKWVMFFTLVSSLIFIPVGWHFVITMAAFLFMIWGRQSIMRELSQNIRVDAGKSIKSGSALLILSLALVISSQYYFNIQNTSAELILPKFKLEGLTSQMTGKVLSFVNPQFKDMSDGNLTVDEVILKTQKKQLESQNGNQSFLEKKIDAAIDAQYGKNISTAKRQALKDELLKKGANLQMQLTKEDEELILEQGRKQLGEMAGTEVLGSEKMADVFSEIVNNRINSFIVPDLGKNKNLILLPIIVAGILFLMVFSLGSFLSRFLAFFAHLIFLVLMKLGIVRIEKVMQEVEKIA